MPETRSSPFISPPLPNAVPTDVDVESPATCDYGRAHEAREAWQNLIDYRLIEWGRDATPFDDEGVEPPTGETIRLAIALAQESRNAGFAPPDSVVPDPNGGIVFERREKNVSGVFHVWDDGTVEYCGFQGTHLVERWTL